MFLHPQANSVMKYMLYRNCTASLLVLDLLFGRTVVGSAITVPSFASS